LDVYSLAVRLPHWKVTAMPSKIFLPDDALGDLDKQYTSRVGLARTFALNQWVAGSILPRSPFVFDGLQVSFVEPLM